MSQMRFAKRYQWAYSTFRALGADPRHLPDHEDSMEMVRHQIERMMYEIRKEMANRGATAHGPLQMSDDRIRLFTPALIIDDPDTYVVRVWSDALV